MDSNFFISLIVLLVANITIFSFIGRRDVSEKIDSIVDSVINDTGDRASKINELFRKDK